jgi:folate-binding Fe-S cluster repair protein YgfZ
MAFQAKVTPCRKFLLQTPPQLSQLPSRIQRPPGLKTSGDSWAGKMSATPANGFFEVHGRTRFQLSGPDATRYLNGQVSIDVLRLTPLTARPACLLTAKGKLCALLQIWREGDKLLIECDASIADAVHARLERYLIADDALLEPAPMAAPLHHIFGAEAPAGALSINRTGILGFDIQEKLTGQPEATPAQLELLRIIHGQPAWGLEITEDTLPRKLALRKRPSILTKAAMSARKRFHASRA